MALIWNIWWYREVRVLRISWGASTAYLTVQHDWFIHTSKFFATILKGFFEFASIFCAVQSGIIAKLISSKTFSIISFESQIYVCFKQIKNSCQKSTSKRSRIESLRAQMLKDNDARFFFVSEFFLFLIFFSTTFIFLGMSVCSTKK